MGVCQAKELPLPPSTGGGNHYSLIKNRNK